MRVKVHILATILLAGLAVAQSAPASQSVKQNSQPSNPKSGAKTAKGAVKNPFAPKAKAVQPAANAPVKAKVAAKPAGQTPAPKQGSTTRTKAASKPPQPAPKQAEVKKPAKTAPAPETKPQAAPAVAQNAPAKLPSPGKRDPFLSPLAASAAKGPGTNCTSGKRCLAVDQIVLKGIVQMKSGNLALVENIARRPYYLHENDSLFNGSVLKITGDSVTFREESSDVLGRPVSKEVVKKVSAPAV